MNFKQHHNLFSLWGYSFAMISRVWWRVGLVWLIFSVVLQVVLIVLKAVVSFLGIPTLFSGGNAGSLILLLEVFSFLVITSCCCYFVSIVMHLFSQVINQARVSVMDAMTKAFSSLFSLLCISICISGISFLIQFIFAKYPLLKIVVLLILCLTVFIRWIYASGYVVLQQLNFLDSMSASWDLTRSHYSEALMVGIISVVSYFVYMGLMALGIFLYGVKVGATSGIPTVSHQQGLWLVYITLVLFLNLMMTN